MVQIKQVTFLEVPTEYPVKGQHLDVKTDEFDLKAVPANGAILKVLQVDLSPYMRGRLRKDETKSYNAAMTLGAAIDGIAVSQVIESNNDKFPKGTLVLGRQTKHQEYQAVDDMSHLKIIENKYNLPIEHYLGVLGMPGQTAYGSLYEIGAPQKGETIFISAASGAVGSIVGQLAKQKGLYVVGSVGSDEKVEYLLKDLKFDAAFNYKKEKITDALPKYCKNGIDIYFDNVGGEILDACLLHANPFARFIECGMISQYNLKPEDRYPIRNITMLVPKKIKMQGFIVSDLDKKLLQEAITNMEEMLHKKEMIYKEDVTEGIDNEIDAFVGMLQGKNFGKTVVKYSEPEKF